MLLNVSDSSAQTADSQQTLLLCAAVRFTELLQSHLHSAKDVIQRVLEERCHATQCVRSKDGAQHWSRPALDVRD